MSSSGWATEDAVIIQASRGLGRLGLNQAWEYRELLYFLAWRDVKVRHKLTVLGVLWVECYSPW
jgi:lipopolysaccharide transport system permease protein